MFKRSPSILSLIDDMSDDTTSMTTSNLRRQLVDAKLDHRDTSKLMATLKAKKGSLHPAIILPPELQEQTLYRFVMDYLDSAPEHIDILNRLLEEANCGEYVRTLIEQALHYFDQPPELLRSLSPMHRLLGCAYITHRLFEEMNDKLCMLYGEEFAPIDMSSTNLIAHYLLGEETANALDHLVLLAIETTPINQNTLDTHAFTLFSDIRRIKGWKDITGDRQRLQHRVPIDINFQGFRLS